jgi:hypothetical protein
MMTPGSEARRRGCAALLFFVALPHVPSANAGILDFFLPSGALSCKHDDRACIVETAARFVATEFKNREVKENIETYAMRAGRFTAEVNADEAMVRKVFIDAGADQQFFMTFDQTLKESRAPAEASFEALETALKNKASPDSRDLPTFVRNSFESLLKTDSKRAIALWYEHFDFLWAECYTSVKVVHQWMTANNLDELERYAETYVLPKSSTYDPWEEMSYAAGAYCHKGEKASGERVLAILEADKSTWKPDRILKAADWSALTEGVLHCRGYDAANAMIEPVFLQMQADMEQERAVKRSEEEQKFVLGVIRSEVAEDLIGTLVLWLNKNNREAEARRLFARLPVTESSIALGDIGKGPVGMEFPEQDYATFIEQSSDAIMYGEDSSEALDYFLKDFKPDFTVCCRKEDYMSRAVDYAEQLWPQDIARRAAVKALELQAGVLAQEGPEFKLPPYDTLQVRVARLQKLKEGCNLSEAKVASLFASINSYRFGTAKADVLQAYVNYLDTKPAALTNADCIIK